VARGPDYNTIMMVNSPDDGKGSRIYLNMYALF
ncbi:hypothetical protein A2U01_0031418, partial [Trifolium medium]|nr:hypothetical protein [Trifolium medium]